MVLFKNKKYKDDEFYKLQYFYLKEVKSIAETNYKKKHKNKLEDILWYRATRIIFCSLANIEYNYDKLEEYPKTDYLHLLLQKYNFDDGVFGFKLVREDIIDYTSEDVVVREVYKDNYSSTFVQITKQILLPTRDVSEVKFEIVEPYNETIISYKLKEL